MDLAYDHIAEESYPKDGDDNNNSSNQNAESSQKKPEHTLNQDLQEAYLAVTRTTWGRWLNTNVENAIKQVCQVISVYKQSL